jgi:CBS domain containing-hemolysin-like protein
MSEGLWSAAIIAVLLLLNAFFVAAEFAIAAAPGPQLARLAESGSGVARRALAVLRSTRLLNEYISTAQVGITIASLGLGMYGEHAVAEWLLGPLEHWGWLGVAAAHTVATVLSVAILTYLHVVIGEMVPKSLALATPARTALRLSAWMSVVQSLFRPLTALLNWIGDWLLRLVGMPPADASAHLISSTELEYIVEESAEGGLLEPTEQLYLENVIDFGERTIGQVMTPRTRMQALPVSASTDEVLRRVYEHGYSRYPVYQGDRDHIVGVLHVKDLARQISRGGEQVRLPALIRPAVFAPETLSLEQMLKRFRGEHIQVAIVVDEFGGTAGLITLEDLVEELIGEIQDEFDEEIPPIEEITPQALRVRGDLLIDELNQHYELNLTHNEADTVGGLVMTLLERIPESGERVRVGEIELEVESTEGLAVNTLIVHLPLPLPPAADGQPEPDRSEAYANRDNVWSTSA